MSLKYTQVLQSVVVVVFLIVINIQTSSALKQLGQSKPNFMWSMFRKWERKFVYMIRVT